MSGRSGSHTVPPATYSPALLSLDERLNEIQVMLMTGSPPKIHDEIVDISRTLTEYVQGMS